MAACWNCLWFRVGIAWGVILSFRHIKRPHLFIIHHYDVLPFSLFFSSRWKPMRLKCSFITQLFRDTWLLKCRIIFLYTCVARQCEFTIEVINLKQLPQSFCGLGGLCAVYSPHICYNNLSDQFSDVPHLLELIGGIYIHGSSLTMKSVSLKYIQRTSKRNINSRRVLLKPKSSHSF